MLLTKQNEIIQTIVTENNEPLFDGGTNPTTSDGVELNKKYKLIYQIQNKNGVNPKKFEFVRKGSDIVSDLSFMSSYFRNMYQVPNNEFLYHLRTFVKTIVMVHSTLHIKGRGPKVIKQLRKSVQKVMLKNILREMKDPNWIVFLKSCLGTYMWFKFQEKEPNDNCVIFTDIEQLNQEEIDEFIANGNPTEMFKRMMTESQMRQTLLNGFIKCEWVQIDLDETRPCH